MDLSDLDPGISPTEHSTAPNRPWWPVLILAATAAAVAAVNGLVLFAGRAAADGGELVIRTTGAAPHPIHLSDVLISSIVPLLVGTGLAVLLARWWPRLLVVAQVIGAGLALLSALGPLSSQSDGATRLSLALMHTLVGVGVVIGLQAVRKYRAG